MLKMNNRLLPQMVVIWMHMIYKKVAYFEIVSYYIFSSCSLVLLPYLKFGTLQSFKARI